MDSGFSLSRKMLAAACVLLSAALSAAHSLQRLADGAADSPEKLLRLEARAYFLEAPLKLGARHSGLKIVGQKGTLITSFKKIENWERDGKFWRAKIPGENFVSSVFVNGRRAQVASTPNDGFRHFVYRGTNARRGDNRRTFFVRKEDVAELAGLAPDQLRRAHFQIYRAWVDNRARISAIRPMRDGKTCAVEFSLPASPHIYGGDYALPRYKIANFMGALDAPGEFFFDAGAETLFYIPREGEDMKTAEVFYPTSDRLLEISGGGEDRAKDISFEGVAFAGASARPDNGEKGWTASSQAAANMPSAVSVSGATGVKFKGCEFSKLDGFALEFRENADFCAAESCIFSDLGAGGARAGLPERGKDARVSNISIKNNIVCGYGRIDRSAAGVTVFDSGSNEISHNEIFDGYYTGISVGWTWGGGPTRTKNNIIEFNKIHDLSYAQMCDLGGIYTLGSSEGSKIRGNLIYGINCHQYGGWGIYNDEGSSGFEISGNFVRGAQEGGYYMHYGKNCKVENNVFCHSSDFQIGLEKNGDNSFSFERNVVIYDSPAALFRNGRAPAPNAVKFDRNVYWNGSGEVLFGKMDFGQWRESGRDGHSFVEKADAEALLDGGKIEKIGFKPIAAKRAGTEGEAARRAREILKGYRFPKIVRYPARPDWNNGAFDDFTVGETGRPPAYMNIERSGASADVVGDDTAPAGRALELGGGARVSQYCRFSKGKYLEFSLAFKLSENSDFSCGTESGAFFSVKGAAIMGAEDSAVPRGKWVSARGKIPFPLKGGEKWTLVISGGGEEKSFEMRLPEKIRANPTRFAFESGNGPTRIADIKMDAR